MVIGLLGIEKDDGPLGIEKDVSMKGTYELKWDTSKTPVLCTGTVKLLAADSPMEADFDLTVTPDGQRVEMIHTNKGLIVNMISLPAKTRGCRNATIRGTYTYSTSGWALMPGVPADQTLAGYVTGAMSGAFQFSPNIAPSSAFPDAPEGSAMVNGWDSLSVNGTAGRRKMMGWYKIEPDCSGIMVVRDNLGYPDFRIRFFVGEEGNVVHAVNVNIFETPDGKLIPMFVMPIPMLRADLHDGH